MEGVHTWVINLDRAPERMARVSGQLQRLGLPFTRVPAVDARALRPEQAALLDVEGYQRKHGMAPAAGELGCYLSHLEAMRAFLASGAEAALILEDDVVLGPSLPAVLQALQAQGARWDVVKLTAVHSGTPVGVAPLLPGVRLCVMLSKCTAASAYLLNRRAAEVYLRRLLPMQLPFDHAYDRVWELGLRMRLVSPTPCEHDSEIETTIGVSNAPSRKFSGWRRLPAHAFRLATELRRVSHGLRQLAGEWLGGQGRSGEVGNVT